MIIPYIKGKVAKQAHVNVPENTFEEEYARNGFSGRYAHLYRSNPPVGWKSIEGPLRPQAFNLQSSFDLSSKSQDYLLSRKPWLKNSEVVLYGFALSDPMNYAFRNADADEVLFIHEGTGKIDTDFGPLSYEQGDYLVIPRGTSYRLNPAHGVKTLGLCFESFSEIRLPDKGMLGQHALFDPAVVRVPDPSETAPTSLSSSSASKDYELRIQRLNQITRVVYPFDPLQTVGWKGTLTVWQINIRDIRPVSSDRYHLPPSAHTTFLGHGFVICSFLPRPLENGDPGAMKVPFYHSNIDFDEVLFYHRGQFFSRKGIGPGMLTFHPQGIHHGPQPGAEERTRSIKETDEVAVMLDTRNPLVVCEGMGDFENKDYWRSWQK